MSMAMLCPPISGCPCLTWLLPSCAQYPLYIDWRPWLATLAGYSLSAIEQAALFDVNVNPPVPADPEEIALVSGFDSDPPANGGAPGYTQIIGGFATGNIIKAGPNATVGRVYRLDITVVATDGCGRKAKACECVSINIVQ